MYRYKNLHFRFSADICTSTFVTANIFPWYLSIRENFANGAVTVAKVLAATRYQDNFYSSDYAQSPVPVP